MRPLHDWGLKVPCAVGTRQSRRSNLWNPEELRLVCGLLVFALMRSVFGLGVMCAALAGMGCQPDMATGEGGPSANPQSLAQARPSEEAIPLEVSEPPAEAPPAPAQGLPIKPFGAYCDHDWECASMVCSIGDQRHFCSRFCEKDEDCWEGVHKCNGRHLCKA
jgi:hypothetical protein